MSDIEILRSQLDTKLMELSSCRGYLKEMEATNENLTQNLKDAAKRVDALERTSRTLQNRIERVEKAYSVILHENKVLRERLKKYESSLDDDEDRTRRALQPSFSDISTVSSILMDPAKTPPVVAAKRRSATPNTGTLKPTPNSRSTGVSLAPQPRSNSPSASSGAMMCSAVPTFSHYMRCHENEQQRRARSPSPSASSNQHHRTNSDLINLPPSSSSRLEFTSAALSLRTESNRPLKKALPQQNSSHASPVLLRRAPSAGALGRRSTTPTSNIGMLWDISRTPGDVPRGGKRTTPPPSRVKD
eukprot:PhM_4_TR3383/c0_g1_i2/m.10665